MAWISVAVAVRQPALTAGWFTVRSWEERAWRRAGTGPFRALPGELRAAFSNLETLLDRERDGEATLLARRVPVPRPPGSPPARRPRS